MARIVIVLGDTGSGKSRSIKGLNPKETVVVNTVENKDLPWKGSAKDYSATARNLFHISEYKSLTSLLLALDTEAKHVKNVVLDDVRYLMENEFCSRAKETGFGKFTEIGQHFQQLLSMITKLRNDLTFFLMLHDDDVESDKVIVKKKPKLVGRLVEEHFNPLELVTICLCAKAEGSKDKVTYNFYTNKTWVDGVELPAKSPEGMFDLVIPNDLGHVAQLINEYYN